MSRARQAVRLALVELRRHARTPWLLVVTLLLLLLGGFAIQLGIHDYDEQRIVYARLVDERVQAQLQSQTPTGRSAEQSLRVVRPPATGALFIQAQERWLPAAWDPAPAGLEILAPYAPRGRRLEGGGALDIDLLTRLLGTLGALGLGLVPVLSDRSSGWAGALRRLPLSPGTASVARIAGGSSAILLAIVGWWTVMSLTLVLNGRQEFSQLELWSLAPVVAAELLVFYGIGLTLAARISSSAAAMVIAVGAWLCGAVLGPPLLTLTAEATIEVPAIETLESERREQLADETDTFHRTMIDALVPLISVKADVDLDDAAQAVFPKIAPEWRRLAQNVRPSVNALDNEWRALRDSQQSLITRLAWLVPGAAGRESLSEVAGTGRHAAAAWDRAVLAYQRRLAEALFDDRPQANLRLPWNGRSFSMNFPLHPARNLKELPVFKPPDLDGFSRLGNAFSSLTALLIWMTLSLGSAYWAGTRL